MTAAATQAPTFDLAIAGAGIVGRAAALAAAHAGLRVALQVPAAAATAARDDVRAYALNAASVALLTRLKVWDTLPAHFRTAVRDMRVHGDAGGALHFSAWQQGAGELAWIVDVPALEAALEAGCRYAPGITLLGELPPATLTVVAEGKASAWRQQAGVRFVREPYGHSAVAARLVASAAHAGVAWQWFTAPDVLALLPLDAPEPGRSYALVWSQPEARAAERLAADADAFEADLAALTGGAAGELRLASARAAWPLARAHAEPVHGPGWVLVGDAAHLMHPLAGQGLNAGLGDVAVLIATLAAREPWRSLADPALLARYARARQWPLRSMSGVTDSLWHLFSNPHPWVRELRNRGMGLLDRASPVKRWLTNQAMR